MARNTVKGRHKVPSMMAMGVWPDSDHREVLLWRLGESESAEEWVAFLELLEAQGIRSAQGLCLIIHDGGVGLCSTLQTVWFDAAQQTLPVPQAAQHRAGYSSPRGSHPETASATTPEDPEILPTYLGSPLLSDYAPALPPGRAYLP